VTTVLPGRRAQLDRPLGAAPEASVQDVAPPAPEVRRRIATIQERDVLPVVGAAASGLALATLLYWVLLPWTGLIGFAIVSYLLFLGLYAILVGLEGDMVLVKDRMAATLAISVGLLMLVALTVVVVFTFVRGFSALRHLNFYMSDLSVTGPLDPLTQGGMLHAVLGTLVMISIALAVTVPLGVVTAVYLSETSGPLTRFVRTIVEAMTALPSVIAGLFVLAIIVSGFGERSGMAAALALAIMMLPIIIRASDVVLRLVPGTLKEAAAALGAPRWRVVWHVVLPTARSGLMTAIILGTARGIGETSPVLLTAGYVAAYNLNVTSGPMVSLPLATFILTRSPEPNQIARGFGAAAVLMVLVLVLFIVARVLGGRGPGQLTKGQARRRLRASQRDAARFDAAALDQQLQEAALRGVGQAGFYDQRDTGTRA
jgi:phosphate transport system permease protein